MGKGRQKDSGLPSGQGRGTPEGPSSGPLRCLLSQLVLTLSLLSGASDPGMDVESPWCW